MNNCSGRLVVHAATAGAYLHFTGTYSTENSWDSLYVYDGAGTIGTLLYTFTGSGNVDFVSPSGTVTLVFRSDGSVCSYDGFELQVECVTCVPATGRSTLTTCSAVIYDPGGSFDYPDNCNGQLVLHATNPNDLIHIVGW